MFKFSKENKALNTFELLHFRFMTLSNPVQPNTTFFHSFKMFIK